VLEQPLAFLVRRKAWWLGPVVVMTTLLGLGVALSFTARGAVWLYRLIG
jgi:hypothetical protein